MQIGPQGVPVALAHDTKYCESANPPTAAATSRAKTTITGPRRVFFVIGWPRSRSFISLRQEMRS